MACCAKDGKPNDLDGPSWGLCMWAVGGWREIRASWRASARRGGRSAKLLFRGRRSMRVR
eukprot:6677229-Lingulodinium_polyedra.AAC.1